tara:strand:- start:429 stop:764 length:336 start_codon:yes stop_codon:yes gene_type:complete
MGLFVREDLSKFTDDLGSGIVVLESDEQHEFPVAIEDLRSMSARNMAIGYAAKLGCADPRVNGIASPAYAVNQDGESLEKIAAEERDLPPKHPRRQVAAYRVDIPICKKLI